MEEYSDYKGFDILGYHVNSMDEQVLDIICNIVKYDEFNCLDYASTFENLINYYIVNLKNDTLWRSKYVLLLIAGVRNCNKLESIIIENLPEDVYVNYIIKRR